jgi:hypothetical protein
MLVSLSERIQVDLNKEYDTHFKVKHLNRSLTEIELKQLKTFIYKAHDREFPSTDNLLKYYIEGKYLNVSSPVTDAFCSQLTAETFMEMGFIATKYASNGYCPDDFNKCDNMPSLQPFCFVDGARLG